jgi:hypothetical protein
MAIISLLALLVVKHTSLLKFIWRAPSPAPNDCLEWVCVPESNTLAYYGWASIEDKKRF